jgi:hypothetical protein
MTTKRPKKPGGVPHPSGTAEYMYARKLYFESSVIADTLQVVRAYSFRKIAQIIRTEFNRSIPESTIRRWAISPDKDFNGRTWVEEWDYRMKTGVLSAIRKVPIEGSGENHTKSPTPVVEAEVVETTMQKLSRLKERSLVNDATIALFGDNLVIRLMKEIDKDIETTGKIPIEKMKLFYLYHSGAKVRSFDELKDIEALESRLDSETLYGADVRLKDPQKRERARNAMLELIRIAEEEAEELGLIPEIEHDSSKRENTEEAFGIDDLELKNDV